MSAALTGVGCGNGQPQDVQQKAPHGNFAVTVLQASFPSSTQLARNSDLVIRVRNDGNRTIPNINVTTKCPHSGLASSFETLSQEQDVADPRRPQFVVRTIPTLNSQHRPPLDPAPLERSSALVDTYPLGPLKPGQVVTFDWGVTAVAAGPYDVCYHVNADLYGDAHAVPSAASLPLVGNFPGYASNAAPTAGVNPDTGAVTPSNGP